MFISIGTALVGLFGRQVSGNVARLIGIASLIGLAIVTFLIWLAIHDHRVIRDHNAAEDAKFANAVVSADRYAAERKEARDQDFTNSQAAVTNAISNAVKADPEQGKKPVGPASQSYYDEIRRQKGKTR